MEYRTVNCPRCELPVLSGIDKDGDITQFCMNCGLEYVKSECITSYGIAVINYNDGRCVAESTKSPAHSKTIKTFKDKLKQEDIDIEHSYLTNLNSKTFGVDTLVGKIE